MAVTKEGFIRGYYTDQKELVDEVFGSIDKKTLRVAWQLKLSVPALKFETSVDSLSSPVSLVDVYNSDAKPKPTVSSWQLIQSPQQK